MFRTSGPEQRGVYAAAAILSWHQNGGYGDCCLTAEWCVCVWNAAATAYPIRLDKMATICLTNPHSAFHRTRLSEDGGERKIGWKIETLLLSPRRANDGAPAKSVPLELTAVYRCIILSSPVELTSPAFCLSLSPLLLCCRVNPSSLSPSPSPSASASSTGLLEEREGQRPAVSHRGVSPQGQYFVSWQKWKIK